MEFRLNILGTASALPVHERNMTSQFLKIGRYSFLIDCAEGTLAQLYKYKLKWLHVDGIFISHLHGDHFFGIFGLLSTMSLLGRKQPLRIFGPSELHEVILTLFKVSNSVPEYPIDFIDVPRNEPSILWENSDLKITSFPLFHRISATGFRFQEKKTPVRVNANLLPEGIPGDAIKRIISGENVEFQGVFLDPKKILLPKFTPRSYAFCSDTSYNESYLPSITGVDLLYHEATFLKEKEAFALKTGHSTTIQAAEAAKLAQVGALLLGHYSSRYKDVSVFEEQAKSVFVNTIAAKEGDIYDIELQEKGPRVKKVK